MIDRAAKDRLKSFVERIERLEEEKKEIADDIREVYAEAKGNGFDTKALRQIIKLRKIDVEERKEQEAILDVYKQALGMLADTPLGESAMERASRNSKARLSESMKDAADVSQELAHKGLISQEAAEETAKIAERVAKNPKVRAAVKQLGTPTELTEEERAKGYSAAFIGKGGTRMAIGVNPSPGTTSLTNPRHVASAKSVQEIADRAEETKPPPAGAGSEPPRPHSLGAAAVDDPWEIPPGLRRAT